MPIGLFACLDRSLAGVTNVMAKQRRRLPRQPRAESPPSPVPLARLATREVNLAVPNGNGRWQMRGGAIRGAIVAVGLVLAWLMLLPVTALGPEQRIPPLSNLLDFSWECDLPARAGQGEWCGRDFVFTYGPLYQAVHGWWHFLRPGDLAGQLRWTPLPVCALVLAALWRLLRGAGAPAYWAVATLLIWTAVDFDPHVKPVLGLYLIAMSGHSLADGPPDTSAFRHRWSRRLLWFAGGPLALMYCFDLGVMTLVGQIVVAIAAAGLALYMSRDEFRRRRIRIAESLTCTLAGCAMILGGISILPGWENYLTDTLDLARGYSLYMASPLAPAASYVLLAAGLVSVGTALICLVGIYRRSATTGNLDPQLTLLASAAVCGFVWLRYGLTRSDRWHVFEAILPTVFIVCGLWPGLWRGAGRRRFAAWGLMLALAARGWWMDDVAALWKERVTLAWPWGTVGAGLVADPLHLEVIEGVQASPATSYFVWPYETVFPHLAGKRNVCYTAQSFSAHSDHLQRRTCEQLEATRNLDVFFFLGSPEIDAMPHMARTPQLFRHLLDRFELRGEPSRLFARLQPAAAARNWRVEPVAGFRPLTVSTAKAARVRLAIPADADIRASSMLEIRCRATAGASWLPRKPARLMTSFVLDNGRRTTRMLPLLQRGDVESTLVCPLDFRHPILISVFDRDRYVQAKERVAFIDFTWIPIDFLTPRPSEVVIEQLGVLRRDNVTVTEASLEDVQDPLLRRILGLESTAP